MALRKVQSGAIADNAITSAKIASGAVTAADLNSDVSTVINNVTVDTVFTGDSITLPAGTTAERPSSATVGMVRYNTTLGFLEQYTSDGWQGVAPPPAIVSVSPTTYSGEQGTEFTINGSNFDSTVSVKFITAQGTEYSASVVTRVSNSQLTATTPQDFTIANEPLKVKVINGSGLSYTLDSAIDCGGVPTWNTASGSLGTVSRGNAFSTTLSAGDPDAGATITYSVASGSLLTGLSLNSSTGVISGTYPLSVAPVDSATTTASFTIRATDNAGNTTDRAFTITGNNSYITSAFSYTGSQQTFTVPSDVSSLKLYAWGAGGGGGDNSSGGSGGYAEGTLSTTGGTTYSIIVGGGGAGYYTTNAGGAGGGLTGIFSGGTTVPFNSTGRARAIMIAGGAGGGSGGSGSEAMGGAGGGNEGNRGYHDYRGGPYGAGSRSGGYGGTQSAGGAIAPDTGGTYNPGNTAGSDLQGGVGSYSGSAPGNGGFGGGGSAGAYAGGAYGGGGGGGGYFGGGGGQDYYSSAGGGGSGYVGGVTSATNTTGNDGNRSSANNPPNTGSAYYSSGVGVGNFQSTGGHGRLVVRY